MSVALALACFWTLHGLGGGTASSHAETATRPAAALRLGVIPERDIYQQRKAYRALGDYLESKRFLEPGGQGKVELVTATSYDGVLQDFAEGRIDAAFAGSLVAVMAADRYGAQIVLKSQGASGKDTYSGIIFVRDDSPAASIADLDSKRVGAVRTTMAGAVFPVYALAQAHTRATLVWTGTHDDVIRDVMGGQLDAGAVKDLRLAAYQQAHPESKLRVLAESGRVPDNALLLRKGLPEEKKKALVAVLLGMDKDPAGASVLAAMEVKCFNPCQLTEYAPLFDMIDGLGPAWSTLDPGPAPRRPATRPAEFAPAAERGR